MNSNHSLAIRLVSALVGAGLSLLIPSVAFAGNVSKEVATAIQHAGYAKSAKNLKGVHMHLHHALNCLEGPHGSGFNSHFMDPCKGMGNGAISDSQGKTKRQVLMDAASEAKRGIQEKSLPMARKDAGEVQSILKKSEMSQSSM